MKMNFEEVAEGKTKLFVPKSKLRTKRDPIFYNPEMELARDISVGVCRILKPENYFDALSGSGARGLRIAGEVGVDVTLNDLNKKACELIEKNAKLNRLDVKISNDDSNHFLSNKKFEFIDIDPFGPPVRYLDTAIRAFGKRGFLGVAATDTSVLCGTYPTACQRKYDAISLRTDYYNELGLRIFIGFIARNAVRYDYGVNILFSHCTRHYFRIYAELDRGRKYVKKTQGDITFLQHCFSCLEKKYKRIDELEKNCECGCKLKTAGPLWNAEFADSDFSKKLSDEIGGLEFRKGDDEKKLVNLIAGEQKITKPYYDFHKLCRKVKKSVPRMDFVFERLKGGGFKVARTHFSGLGIRTDANSEDILGFV